MRKLLLSSLFIFLSIPCFAEAFLSNALGQDLGAIDSLSGMGYEGERNGDVTAIYHDGNIIRKRTEAESGYTIETEDSLESVILNDDGERAEWRRIADGREEVHTYFYEDGRLSSVSVSIDGSLVRRLVYLETPSGTLAGITGTNDSYISPSFYLYELDGNAIRISYHSNGTVTRENLSDPAAGYEVEDDGSWRESDTTADGEIRERLYSPDGRLKEETAGGNTTRYEYDDDGELYLSVSVSDDGEVRSYYDSGRIIRSETLSGGVMSRVRNYLDSGEIEEIRYRDGQPEYSILFEGDGLRVKEIHRL